MADIRSEVEIKYRKFKIEYFWARNKFRRSNMDYRLVDVTCDGVNDYVKKFIIKDDFARNMFCMDISKSSTL